jgi:hypothetical protein
MAGAGGGIDLPILFVPIDCIVIYVTKKNFYAYEINQYQHDGRIDFTWISRRILHTGLVVLHEAIISRL